MFKTFNEWLCRIFTCVDEDSSLATKATAAAAVKSFSSFPSFVLRSPLCAKHPAGLALLAWSLFLNQPLPPLWGVELSQVSLHKIISGINREPFKVFTFAKKILTGVVVFGKMQSLFTCTNCLFCFAIDWRSIDRLQF